ncbi:hypothetical protein CDD81_3486 [Ophiocordyceps australis]|uniref:Mid2 domain-containing protein n=1 Tax=Ophiocordyceps australis TaxID=1399860 RepID=A0A2C5XJQ0_9HYPO|nr:hypothetical protein CDD81_3486 [Ophiocordyceps australis]
MAEPSARLGITCPKRGDFYTCVDRPASSRFMGCCTTDPCALTNGTCPDEQLQPASFGGGAYGLISAQACFDVKAEWYTCATTRPRFMGCCVHDACRMGHCAQEYLRAARLSEDDDEAGVFLSVQGAVSAVTTTVTQVVVKTRSEEGGTTKSAGTREASMSKSLGGASQSRESVSRVQATASRAEAVATQTPLAKTGGVELTQGAVAGIAVGSTLSGFMAVMLVVYMYRRLRQRRRESSSEYADTSRAVSEARTWSPTRQRHEQARIEDASAVGQWRERLGLGESGYGREPAELGLF